MTADGAAGETAVARPHLRIVSGNPTAEEIAIVTAVLAAAGGDDIAQTPTPSLWSRPVMRRDLPHGVGGWRASGLPSR